METNQEMKRAVVGQFTDEPPQPTLRDVNVSLIAAKQHLEEVLCALARLECDLCGGTTSPPNSKPAVNDVPSGLVINLAEQAHELANDILRLSERLISLEKRVVGS